MTPATIHALATAPGRAAVAVVRVSGPGALGALEALAGRAPPARRASLAALRDPRDGALIDRAIVIAFPAPASFTGEDAAEFQLHGGRAVAAKLLAALDAMPGHRRAEAGEFARRAMAHGRLDLAGAEALADLVDAETEAQRAQAVALGDGRLARAAARWRGLIAGAGALLEAELDFADEGDVEGDVGNGGATARAAALLAPLRAELARALAAAPAAERLREGLRVVLAGPPNAGKSSLLNALAGREAAIVSPEPGTTRDVLELHLDLGGLPVTLADTAGLREAEGAVEREGVARARARLASCDLALWLDPLDAPCPPPPGLAGDPRLLAVRTKADIAGGAARGAGLAVSARTGEGLAALAAAVAARAAAAVAPAADALAASARARAELAAAAAALDRLAALPGDRPEVAAEELRLAARALERLVGRVDAEAVLDALFARYCIGK